MLKAKKLCWLFSWLCAGDDGKDRCVCVGQTVSSRIGAFAFEFFAIAVAAVGVWPHLYRSLGCCIEYHSRQSVSQLPPLKQGRMSR